MFACRILPNNLNRKKVATVQIVVIDSSFVSNKFNNLSENSDIMSIGNDITANRLYLTASIIFRSYKDFTALVAPQPAQGIWVNA